MIVKSPLLNIQQLFNFGAVQVSAVFRIVENQEELVVGEFVVDQMSWQQNVFVYMGAISPLLSWDFA